MSPVRIYRIAYVMKLRRAAAEGELGTLRVLDISPAAPGTRVPMVDLGCHAVRPDPSVAGPVDRPRAMVWTRPDTTRTDVERIIGTGCGERVHAIEYCWLEAMRTVRLYAYRLPAHTFRPIGTPQTHAHVATEPVAPLGPPESVGDLFEHHAEAGIQLRVLTNLWPFWDAVTTSTLGFSGIRLRNATPRERSPHPTTF